jgi:hypothetical protein
MIRLRSIGVNRYNRCNRVLGIPNLQAPVRHSKYFLTGLWVKGIIATEITGRDRPEIEADQGTQNAIS